MNFANQAFEIAVKLRPQVALQSYLMRLVLAICVLNNPRQIRKAQLMVVAQARPEMKILSKFVPKVFLARQVLDEVLPELKLNAR